MDNAHLVDLDRRLCGSAATDLAVQRLKSHLDTWYRGNTEETSKIKTADWTIFSRIAYNVDCKPLGEVAWPIPLSEWCNFLIRARLKVASYQRFKVLVCNVAEVANGFWSIKLNVNHRELDPRLRYSLSHSRTMRAIKREHGMGVTQAEAITMEESRNACKFGDADSIMGVAMCAAFATGAGLGGRRPRSLTSVLLKHVVVSVGEVEIGGSMQKVPMLKVFFKEEKFDDLQGPRQAHERPHIDRYDKQISQSSGFWVYRLFVMRGVFQEIDPIC